MQRHLTPGQGTGAVGIGRTVKGLDHFDRQDGIAQSRGGQFVDNLGQGFGAIGAPNSNTCGQASTLAVMALSASIICASSPIWKGSLRTQGRIPAATCGRVERVFNWRMISST
jgi:hypothetical protein